MAAFQWMQSLCVFGVFASLISDTATGLASGLARSLAFATAAVLRAFAQVAGLNGLNVFHVGNLHINIYEHYECSTSRGQSQVKMKREGGISANFCKKCSPCVPLNGVRQPFGDRPRPPDGATPPVPAAAVGGRTLF